MVCDFDAKNPSLPSPLPYDYIDQTDTVFIQEKNRAQETIIQSII